MLAGTTLSFEKAPDKRRLVLGRRHLTADGSSHNSLAANLMPTCVYCSDIRYSATAWNAGKEVGSKEAFFACGWEARRTMTISAVGSM